GRCCRGPRGSGLLPGRWLPPGAPSDALPPPGRSRSPDRRPAKRSLPGRPAGALFPSRAMITSPHNEKLKLIRKLRSRRERERSGLFCAEGEDLVDAAAAAGWEAELLLRAGEDVEPELLASVSALGSGSRVIGVYRRRHSEPGGELCVYLEGVRDPGNVGAIIRSAHAFADGPVVIGPGCADPFGPKAVRAAMGSTFARPPARAALADLAGAAIALDARAPAALADVELAPPVILGVGAARPHTDAAGRARVAERGDGGDGGAVRAWK